MQLSTHKGNPQPVILAKYGLLGEVHQGLEHDHIEDHNDREEEPHVHKLEVGGLWQGVGGLRERESKKSYPLQSNFFNYFETEGCCSSCFMKSLRSPMAFSTKIRIAPMEPT